MPNRVTTAVSIRKLINCNSNEVVRKLHLTEKNAIICKFFTKIESFYIQLLP